MESREGRTMRVYKMYETRGLGGESSISRVVQMLISNIEYGTLDDIGYILPVWNRNEQYLNMLKSDIINISGTSPDPYSTYYVEDWRVLSYEDIDKNDYRQYLADMYDINISVQGVYVIEYHIARRLLYSTVGSTQRMLVFETDNKYFVGGVYYGIGECTVDELRTVSDYYRGELDEEY